MVNGGEDGKGRRELVMYARVRKKTGGDRGALVVVVRS